MSTLSGFNDVLVSEMILPAILKIRSEATLVAHVHKYFLGNVDKIGNLDDSIFHHSKGQESVG